jgi:hypothetical protein
LSNSKFNDYDGKPKPPTFPQAQPEPQPKDLTPEDLALARAVRTLQDVSGQDLSPQGIHQLDVANKQLARIAGEAHQAATVIAASVPHHAHA